MNRLFFDIETYSQDEAAILPLLPPFDRDNVKVGNYGSEKALEKIKKAEADHREDWLAKAALNPVTGRVVVFGWMVDEGHGSIVDLVGGNEVKLLTDAWQILADELRSGGEVVGFNIKSFDLPFMIKRSWILKVCIPPDIRYKYKGRSYWHESIIDLRDEWTFGERYGEGKLEDIARWMGVGLLQEGSNIYSYVYSMEEIQAMPFEQAIECLKHKNKIDLHYTKEIAERIL
jgi:hypothetical protein